MDQTLGVAARVMAAEGAVATITASVSRPWSVMLPHMAPSVAIRLRVRPGRADPEASEMGAPGHLAAKAPGLVVRQLGDVGSRQIVPAHIGHGGVDHVVARNSMFPALRSVGTFARHGGRRCRP